MMTFKTKRGTLSFPVDHNGASILRLLKHHAPFLELVGQNDHGGKFLVYLGEIEFPQADPLPTNTDRAQLAKLGDKKLS